jgi:predicted AlkP superfamily pyrophosphatase or phosphodiesterase
MKPFCLAVLLLGALPAGAAPAGRVVLVAIDGLRPEFLQADGGYQAPVLQRLAREGARAGAVESVFPSTTGPAHATILTGVRPARHGIAFDTVWDPAFQRTGGYTHASDVRAPALWTATRERQGTTASVFWPASIDAPVDWNLPGVESMPDPLAALRRHATAGLLADLEKAAGPASKDLLASAAMQDAYAAKAAAGLLAARKPHLLLVRLVQAGLAQQEHGRSHDAVAAAVRWTDEALDTIVKGIDGAGLAAETTLVVTGDHGCVDYDRICAPNAVLREAGLIAGDKPTSAWLVVAHTSGAAAAVYVDKSSPLAAAEVEKKFRAQAEFKGSPVYTILPREQLDALGTMPGAAFGLEAETGWSFSGDMRAKTPFLRSVGKTKGAHGHRPLRAGMETGLVLWGRGVKAGAVTGRARLVDVAPTIARLMGLSMPEAEGRALAEMLAE